MRNLTNNKIEDSMLKTLWLKQLPQNMQILLQTSKESLHEIVLLADNISEISNVFHLGLGLHSICDKNANKISKSSLPELGINLQLQI